jgi:hypothetical protein
VYEAGVLDECEAVPDAGPRSSEEAQHVPPHAGDDVPPGNIVEPPLRSVVHMEMRERLVIGTRGLNHPHLNSCASSPHISGDILINEIGRVTISPFQILFARQSRPHLDKRTPH